MKKKKVIFSGIQPSGDLHIGNYIGALRQWVRLQGQNESIFCIVDLHAITVPQDPKRLKEKILEITALYIACGIDPDKSNIFIQSENPDHPYLAWIFDCITPIGWLSRMTQFKEKGKKQKDSTSVGLFNYPALMAADILLYNTDLVPVGEDQTQHIELTRDIAEKFNRRYVSRKGGSLIFKKPQGLIDKQSARVMSLQTPNSKMSKSDKNPLGTINLLDPIDEIEKKIKRAVTDSGKEIIYDTQKKPAISNLMVIYSQFSNDSIHQIETRYANKTYSQFKKDLAEVVIDKLKPVQKKYSQLMKDKDYLKQVLDHGKKFAFMRSHKCINKVNQVIGLGR